MKNSIFLSSNQTPSFVFHNATLLFLGIILPFVFGCSDDLSRSEAENLIKSKFQNTETQQFEIYGNGYEYGSMSGQEKQLHRTLANLGIVDCIERSGEMASFFPGIQSMKLTEKGKQYVANQTSDRYKHINLTCKVSDLEFVGVDGISQQKGSNMATVKYSQTRRVTPWGTAINLKDGTFESSAIFTKYDDGWRIGQ